MIFLLLSILCFCKGEIRIGKDDFRGKTLEIADETDFFTIELFSEIRSNDEVNGIYKFSTGNRMYYASDKECGVSIEVLEF